MARTYYRCLAVVFSYLSTRNFDAESLASEQSFMTVLAYVRRCVSFQTEMAFRANSTCHRVTVRVVARLAILRVLILKSTVRSRGTDSAVDLAL